MPALLERLGCVPPGSSSVGGGTQPSSTLRSKTRAVRPVVAAGAKSLGARQAGDAVQEGDALDQRVR